MSKKRQRPISSSAEVLNEILQNQEIFESVSTLVPIKQEPLSDDELLHDDKFVKLVTSETIKAEPLTIKELPADFDIKMEPPPKKRRGRKPKPKPALEDIQPSLLSNTHLPDNVVLKKPRKPRQEKQPHRKPYQKHKKKPINSITIDPQTGRYIIDPTDPDAPENTAGTQTSEMPPMDVRNPADINKMIFQNLFNKRLMKNITVMEENAIIIFNDIDDLKSLKASLPAHVNSKIDRIHQAFKVFHNRFNSLEKNLGDFNTKVVRGYGMSRSCPIPIQTPWALRTEVMNNENTTWVDVQKAINDSYKLVSNKDFVASEIPDEELLKQKASSFFLGRGADASKVPGFILNSEWLNTATGARGDPDMIIVGGGSKDTSIMRTHTVISSFKNDLNAGLNLGDIAMPAVRVMTQDKLGAGVNTQRTLPVCDAPVCQ